MNKTKDVDKSLLEKTKGKRRKSRREKGIGRGKRNSSSLYEKCIWLMNKQTRITRSTKINNNMEEGK